MDVQVWVSLYNMIERVGVDGANSSNLSALTFLYTAVKLYFRSA